MGRENTESKKKKKKYFLTDIPGGPRKAGAERCPREHASEEEIKVLCQRTAAYKESVNRIENTSAQAGAKFYTEG